MNQQQIHVLRCNIFVMAQCACLLGRCTWPLTWPCSTYVLYRSSVWRFHAKGFLLTLKCFISFQHKPGLLHCSMTSWAQNEPQIEPLLFLPTLFSSLFSSICSSSSSTSLSTKTNANRHGARTAEHSHCSYSLCCAVKLLLSEGSASSAAIWAAVRKLWR